MTSISNKTFDLVQDRYDQARFTVYTFLVWACIYIIIEKKVQFKNVSKALSNDTKNRIVSIIHGLVAFWGSIYLLKYHYTPLGDLNLPEHHVLMIVSISYFMYDLICCCYYDNADIALVMHHALAMGGFFSAIYSRQGGCAIMTGLCCAEASNFPMHTRMILRNLGLRYTKAYEVSEFAYFILYSVVRGLISPFMVYQAFIEPLCPSFVKISSIGLLLQSVYYIIEMRKLFMRLRKQQKDRKKLGISYKWMSVPEIVLSLPYAGKNVKKDKVF